VMLNISTGLLCIVCLQSLIMKIVKIKASLRFVYFVISVGAIKVKYKSIRLSSAVLHRVISWILDGASGNLLHLSSG
jgi:hypothetical protein